jgi:hypothetical protein
MTRTPPTPLSRRAAWRPQKITPIAPSPSESTKSHLLDVPFPGKINTCYLSRVPSLSNLILYSELQSTLQNTGACVYILHLCGNQMAFMTARVVMLCSVQGSPEPHEKIGSLPHLSSTMKSTRSRTKIAHPIPKLTAPLEAILRHTAQVSKLKHIDAFQASVPAYSYTTPWSSDGPGVCRSLMLRCTGSTIRACHFVV